MLNIPFFFFISIARDTMIFLSLRIDHDSSLVQTEGQLDFISAARVVCRSLKKKGNSSCSGGARCADIKFGEL